MTSPNSSQPHAPSLSVVMPAFNEEKNLLTAVTTTRETLNARAISHEIIIVDDGSRDGTRAIAEALAKEQAGIIYIPHDKNKGIGAAFWTGVQKASLDYVILVPCDNPWMQDDMNAFLPHMGSIDIIAGARKERTGYSPGLKFMSFVYNRILIGMLFQIPLSDVNWIQMYRRWIFVEGAITIDHPGIFFFAEVLVKARRKGYSMVEVPVTMRKRIHGRPTISRLPVIMNIFRDTIQFFFAIHFSK
ncbi:MAG: glycosyltransferase family 2 protein [Candidatus Omnitrophica bacterium]|nr:glycosyltransferase family 2 protein [Candidatus Omnitrophota bacterium]